MNQYIGDRGELYLTAEYKLIYISGMTEIESHHLAAVTAIMDSERIGSKC